MRRYIVYTFYNTPTAKDKNKKKMFRKNIKVDTFIQHRKKRQIKVNKFPKKKVKENNILKCTYVIFMTDIHCRILFVSHLNSQTFIIFPEWISNVNFSASFFLLPRPQTIKNQPDDRRTFTCNTLLLCYFVLINFFFHLAIIHCWCNPFGLF